MKTREYEVRRLVAEYYYVEATNSEEAKRIAKERGNPAKVTIQNEVAKIVWK